MSIRLSFFWPLIGVVPVCVTMGCAGDIGDPVAPAASDAQTLARAADDPRAWDGRWYLDAGDRRLIVTLEADRDLPRGGTITTEAEDAGASAATPASAPRTLDLLQFDPTTQALAFRDRTEGGFAHYRLRLRDGVATGRVALSSSATPPAEPTAYQDQLIGWREKTFSTDLVPRVFDVVIAGHQRAVVRIDRAPSGAGFGDFIGRFKIHATDEVLNEQLSEDIAVEQWNGRTLVFNRPAAPDRDRFTGTVLGRTIAGTVTNRDGDTRAWTGERAEVLGHGLVARPPASMLDWQTRTRRRLAWLVMAGNPAPLSSQVASLGRFLPIPTTVIGDHRDDSATAWPQKYTLEELAFDLTLPSPSGGVAINRHLHGILAVPATPAPPGGYPIALVANGHWGSAWRTFDPQNTLYWYGDSFARRGYVVLAVDISHRPLADREKLYPDLLTGDDPATGNGSHPAIKDAGLDSEWEEDGERTWDVMRGLDHVLARTDVDRKRVTIVGLSMGGEISEWVGAMDPRINVVVAAGGPPDLAVMQYHGNHRCWRWMRGNVREYVDPSDLDAMVASRTFVRETGLLDSTYSSLSSPFSSDKQSVRRAQPAFEALGGHLIHYLHYDAHVFHVGEPLPGALVALGVTTPVEADAAAGAPWSTDWETNQLTQEISGSLFNEVAP